MHAINHFASIYPSCSRHLPVQVRFTGWLISCKSNHLQAIGFILDESLAHWVDGNRYFFFLPNPSYLAKASYISKQVGFIWPGILPILTALLFVLSQFCIILIIRGHL